MYLVFLIAGVWLVLDGEAIHFAVTANSHVDIDASLGGDDAFYRNHSSAQFHVWPAFDKFQLVQEYLQEQLSLTVARARVQQIGDDA